MIDLVRRSFLIGVGALSLTRDRVEQLVTDSVARGELSAEQGKTLVEEMTQRAEQERQRVETFVRQQVGRALEVAGLVSQSDITRLEARLETLENRVREIILDMSSAQASASSTISASPMGEKQDSVGAAPIALDPISTDPDIEGPGMPSHM